MTQGLFSTEYPRVFQKHQTGPLRAQSGCFWSSLSSADSWFSMLNLQTSWWWPGRGWDLGKKDRKYFKGNWGLSTRRKRERLLSGVQGEREVERRLLSHLELWSTQPSLQGSAPWSQPPFLLDSHHSVALFAVSAPPDLFSKSYFIPPTHFPPLPSFLPPCTMKSPISRADLFSYLTS